MKPKIRFYMHKTNVANVSVNVALGAAKAAIEQAEAIFKRLGV